MCVAFCLADREYVIGAAAQDAAAHQHEADEVPSPDAAPAQRYPCSTFSHSPHTALHNLELLCNCQLLFVSFVCFVDAPICVESYKDSADSSGVRNLKNVEVEMQKGSLDSPSNHN